MASKIISPPKGLTDGFIRHLKPQGKQYEVSDKACAGLCIRVGNSGKKSFTWYYREPETNKRRMMTFGRYGTGDDQLTLSDAREALRTAKIKLDAGELHGTTSSTPKTVSELCEVFYKDRIIPHRRAPEAVLQVINHDIKPVIGNKNITTLSTVAVANCVSIVVERGATTHAGKVTAILKQLFKFAEGRGYIDRSPAYALDKKDLGVIARQRKRWLKTHELKPIWDEISNRSKLSLPTKNALKILLLTGVRTGELLQAKWEHIDLEKKQWFFPAKNTKQLKAWSIHITNEVFSIIKELQGLDPIYLFAGKNGGMMSKKVLGRAMSRLFEAGVFGDMEKATPHDLRRTARTHMERLGTAPHIAEACLNHSLGAINSTYNQNTYFDERREALERWEVFLMLQVNPQENITHIKQAS